MKHSDSKHFFNLKRMKWLRSCLVAFMFVVFMHALNSRSCRQESEQLFSRFVLLFVWFVPGVEVDVDFEQKQHERCMVLLSVILTIMLVRWCLVVCFSSQVKLSFCRSLKNYNFSACHLFYIDSFISLSFVFVNYLKRMNQN